MYNCIIIVKKALPIIKKGLIVIQTLVLCHMLSKYLSTTLLNHSIWSVILYVILCNLWNGYEELRKCLDIRSKSFSLIFCALIAASEVAGNWLVNCGTVIGWQIKDSVIIVLECISFGLLLFLITINYFKKIINKGKYISDIKNEKRDFRKKFVLNFFLIIIGWIPVLLAYYPGIFAYDASNQVMQVLSQEYSTHHPLVHTLLLGGFFSLGYTMENNNLGILLYSLFQMIILAGVMSMSIIYMLKHGMRKDMHAIALLFYAFFPVNSMLAISTTKDVLFAAFILGLMIILWELAENEKMWKSKKVIGMGLFFLIGMLMLRNNAVYACLISCPFIYFILKKNRRRFCILILSGIMTASFFNWGIATLLNAQDGSIVEMLSVPLQQMARVGKYQESELDNDTKMELYSACFKIS